MIDVDRIKEIAHAEAMRLVADGVDPDQAVEWATDLAIKKVRRGNLGDVTVIDEATELAKKGSAVIGPWLWVLSIISFGMAIVNAERIGRIYGSWKAGRKAIKLGEPPRVNHGRGMGNNPRRASRRR